MPAACPAMPAVRKQLSRGRQEDYGSASKGGERPREGQALWAGHLWALPCVLSRSFIQDRGPGRETGPAYSCQAQQVMPGPWGEGERGGCAVQGKAEPRAGGRPQLCSHQLHISGSVFSPEKWARTTHCRQLLEGRHLEPCAAILDVLIQPAVVSTATSPPDR